MAKGPDEKSGGRARGQANAPEVVRELRRQGMTDDEIDQALRKKKRSKTAAFNALKSRHVVHDPPHSPITYRAGRKGTDDELCTVEDAAQKLRLHPRTILRFIHEGRLPATRVGKAFRILRSDFEAFAGLPARSQAPEPPKVTCIVDVPNVGEPLARRWAHALPGALNAKASGDGRPVRPEIIHDPERSELRIVLVTSPDVISRLMRLVQEWSEDGIP